LEVSEDDPLIGKLVADRYRVVRKLGEGGMGVVYQAVHEALRKPVALKLLASSGRIDREAVARFEREAIAAANLRHPNIAEATDFGRLPDGALYLIMEYVEGTTLRRLLREQGKLPPERALTILEQVASALSTAHASDVVHRDLKPENIIVTNAHGRADFVKVIDFGIARIRSATFGGGATGLTKAGTVFGTPEYMAPEQVMGQPVDARADQYALGVLAFEVFTGKAPFKADDIGQLMMMHVGAPIPSTRERTPGLPIAADAVIMKMLGKLPDDRFASVDEAMRSLTAAFAGGPASVVLPPPPASAPGGPTVRLAPSAAADAAAATAATLQSFSFDASYGAPASMSGVHDASPSMSGVHGPPSGPVLPSSLSITGSNPAVTGPHAAQPAVTGPHAAQPAVTGPQPQVLTAPRPIPPGASKRPPLFVIAIALVSLIGALVVVVLLARSLLGGGAPSAEVTAALADWKAGKVDAAASVLGPAITSDPDLANDVTLTRTLAEGVGNEAARDKLGELLRTTPLGRSTAMASALAQVAMKDVADVRDSALDLLRDRQDLLTKEQGSRVRVRDAEDCEALDDAKKEEADLATPDTKRDLERMARDDCKRMLRRPELCETCRGGGKGPGLGNAGGKGKGKKDKKKKDDD
jgi:serine/threonine protein kinase